MKNYIGYSLLLFVIPTFFIFIGCAKPKKLKMLDTRPNVQQGFLLLQPEKPSASVILLCGGSGNLNFISGSIVGENSKNFVVRTRDEFANHDLMVAVLDAPSDKSSKIGLNDYNPQKGNNFRGSKDHAVDIKAVANYLKSLKNVPVWLVGTSAGTASAANAAIRIEEDIDGLVLTSSVTKTGKNWPIHDKYPNGILDMNLKDIKVPTLVVAHKNDQCKYTPPEGAKEIAEKLVNSVKVEVKYFEGGSTPRSKPCQEMSKHGFIGIESKVVEYIADFIKKN